MAKLRHVAISVPDLQKAATFYEEVFDMKRVRENKVAVKENFMLDRRGPDSDYNVKMILMSMMEQCFVL